MDSIFGLSAETLLDYDFDIIDAHILNWFYFFCMSDKMHWIEDEHEKYYWIDRKKIVDDNKILKLDRQAMAIRLAKLCGIRRIDGKRVYDTSKKWPMKKIVQQTNKGRRAYYRLTQTFFDSFKYNKDKKLSEREKSKTRIKQEEKKRKERKEKEIRNKDISARTRKLIEKGVEAKVFSHNLKTEGKTASKILLQIEEYLIQIINGDFLSKNKLDDFWMRKQGIDTGFLDDVKGNWNELENYIEFAVKSYKEWKENTAYTGLTNNMSVWLYNPNTKKSLFLMCLSRYGQEERASKIINIKENIDDRTLQYLEENKKFYRWDDYTFWSGIYSIYTYIINNWLALKDFNHSTNDDVWKIKNVEQIIRNYIRYLKEYESKTKIVGINSYAWGRFVDDFFSETEINLSPSKEGLEQFKPKILKMKRA